MKAENPYKSLIILISIVLPVAVAVLYVLPKTETTLFSFLPLLNAIINGSTFLILIAALVAIKNKNIVLHKRLMWTALILSVAFLLSYVLYHATTPSTSYGGEGTIKYVYFFILLTHILLSAIVVPLVLLTLVRALAEKFDQHRKIAKITLPIWLYVTLTGVLVYLMISPYY
jgi:putative membrane protein